MSDVSPNESSVDQVMVPLDRITTDEAVQTRVQVKSGVVRDYAAAMKEQLAAGGLCFPPVVLFTDGRENWVGDGFHRILAARQAGLTEIAAEQRPGSQRDALLFAISANCAHGLARTRADKRKAVALLLGDAEWSQWSDREIARRCQVGDFLVRQLRRGASAIKSQMRQRKVQRGGSVYEMKVNPRRVAEEATTTESLPVPAVATPTDLLGVPLSEATANVFTALADFQEASALFDRLASLVDRIAQGPAGERYRRELIRTANNGRAEFVCPALRACRSKLCAAEPYCGCCPNCHAGHPGRGHPDCKTCGGLGWTTRAAFEACRASDQERIMRLRTVDRK